MSFRRKITRRQFIKGAAVAGGAMMMPGLGPFVRGAHAYAVSPGLQKFQWRMPMFGARALAYDPLIPDIPLAAQAAGNPFTNMDFYKITAGQFAQQLHRDLPGPTRLFGYADESNNFVHLGGAVLASYGRPVRLRLNVQLPPNQIVPFDSSIPTFQSAGPTQDRAAIHLHGGLVPWTSDGGPFHWQSTEGAVGASVIPWLWDGGMQADGVTPNSDSKVWDYFYPNLQSARLMWYHDHAIGITRTNAYSGLATGYVLTDLVEAALGLPFGDPIVFQDKVFWTGPGLNSNDPSYETYAPGAQPGDLWYPWFYDPAIWPIAPGGVPPTPSAVPEFFGDTMLANGVVYPFHNVNLGMYRFRLLNACNARFLDLSFVLENGSTGEPLLTGKDKKQRVAPANVDVWQIGTEGGFLKSPVPLVTAGVPVQPFILGPAERADIIVRFNTAGNVILYNVAGSPFPGGAPIFDWYIGNMNLPVQPAPGFGPNTRTIMRFAVQNAAGPTFPVPTAIPIEHLTVPTVLDPVNGGLMVDTTQIPAGFTYDPVPVELTLNEVVEPATFTTAGNTGRLLTLLGNRATTALSHPPFGPGGTYYTEPPTETVAYNTIRIWKVYNFTADAHPMHFHLFNVQILGRQRVDKNFLPKAPAVLPLPSELGLKETVNMYPGEVTIVAALVEEPLPETAGYGRTIDPVTQSPRPTVAVTVGASTVNCMLPFSPRLQAAPYNINVDEYVWHCHILEHEEHDMMRPLIASD